MQLAVRQIHPVFVGEASGVDARRPLGPDAVCAIWEAIDRYALPGAAEVVKVVHGELGERAEVLGAVALVTQSTEALDWIGLQTVVQFGSAVAAGSIALRPVGRKEAVHAETS